MATCKPRKPDPQREKALADISAAAKAYYTKNRASSMPTWTELVADAKGGIQLMATTTQDGGALGDQSGATTHRRIVSMAYLLVIMLIAMMGYLMFQGMTSNVPEYRRAITGEGCHDLAYDALYRTTGMSLYAGCAAHHRVRENVLAFLTGYRADLVPDQGTNMQYLINWLTRIFGGSTAMAMWRWVNSRGKKGGDDDDGGDLPPFFPPSPPSSPPFKKGPWGDDGSDGPGGPGGIATGGKRRRTRRSHKKANKTRRRKSHSRRHGRK